MVQASHPYGRADHVKHLINFFLDSIDITILVIILFLFMKDIFASAILFFISLSHLQSDVSKLPR